MMETASQLPSLDSEHPTSTEQRSAYARDGHTVVRGIASVEEVAAYRPPIVEAADVFRETQRPLAERDTYGKAFLQITNLWERDERVRRFVMARRFAQVAADLMGVDGVRLYHDQALFKEPGGGHTPWHQDQFYWPIDEAKTVTMWMPLSEATPDMGTMRFASGSQVDGPLKRVEISDESDAEFDRVVAENGWQVTDPVHYAVGDATFHSGWVLHSAGANPTDRMREAMTIIYFADGSEVTPPKDKFQESDLENWLPGMKPGDLAASPKNPLLFSRIV